MCGPVPALDLYPVKESAYVVPDAYILAWALGTILPETDRFAKRNPPE
jgi:hypothetical protein